MATVRQDRRKSTPWDAADCSRGARSCDAEAERSARALHDVLTKRCDSSPKLRRHPQDPGSGLFALQSARDRRHRVVGGGRVRFAVAGVDAFAQELVSFTGAMEGEDTGRCVEPQQLLCDTILAGPCWKARLLIKIYPPLDRSPSSVDYLDSAAGTSGAGAGQNAAGHKSKKKRSRDDGARADSLGRQGKVVSGDRERRPECLLASAEDGHMANGALQNGANGGAAHGGGDEEEAAREKKKRKKEKKEKKKKDKAPAGGDDSDS